MPNLCELTPAPAFHALYQHLELVRVEIAVAVLVCAGKVTVLKPLASVAAGDQFPERSAAAVIGIYLLNPYLSPAETACIRERHIGRSGGGRDLGRAAA